MGYSTAGRRACPLGRRDNRPEEFSARRPERMPRLLPRAPRAVEPRTSHRTYRQSRPAFRIGNSKAFAFFYDSIILYDTGMKNVPTVRLILLGAALTMAAQGAKTLDLYFIDVEGGQSTLVVSPSGQTLLIDTGYAGNSGRDANRIAAAAKAAGVKKIDTLLITHFHDDHVGGVPNLLERLPVATFLDYGPSVEAGGKYPGPYE